MNPLEQKLAQMKLAAPSERLDARLDETFRAARRSGRRNHRVAFLWWVGATTAAGVVAVVLLLSSDRTVSMTSMPVVYHIEAQDGLREMLLDSATNQIEPTSFELRVEARGSKSQ